MKFKYLKVTGEHIWAKNEITKNDLVDISQGRVDYLFDLESQKYFSATENEWFPFGHD